MKASEILRKLADMIDGQEGQEASPNQAELTPVTTDNTDDTETSTMVPPLQQKLELLKKTAGVDSHYDDECCDGEGADPLDQMKKMAGIAPVVMTVAGDENDIAG